MMKFPTVFATMILAIGSVASHGQTLDYSVTPQPRDNFLEASFRFVNPDPESPPTTILVYIPGTDGDAREIVADSNFLATCKACHAALLGCYFAAKA